MLRVVVSFPSGSGQTLSLPELSKVGDLKILAQTSLGLKCLKLVTVEGHVLTNPEDSLQDAGVQDGEHLTAVAQKVQIAATDRAFAAWCCGGNRVVAWGTFGPGGDCYTVQDQLNGVQEIQATRDGAFAAILADESVVSWGDPDCGGDSSEVQDQLKDVQQLQATRSAFAAILADGSVVTMSLKHI